MLACLLSTPAPADHLSQEIKLTNSSAVWRYLIGYKNLLRAIENLGIAVVYGIRYYGQVGADTAA